MNDVVLTDLRDGVLTVTLNRPDDNNRMDRRTMAAIVAAIAAGRDRQIGARHRDHRQPTPISAAGGGPTAIPTARSSSAAPTRWPSCRCRRRSRAPTCPIVARVGGHCVAGGMSLLSFCDLAVAADDVEFGYPEVNYGQFPALALAVLIPMVPPKEAFDILYSGDRFGAARARELRLVNKVVPRTRTRRCRCRLHAHADEQEQGLYRPGSPGLLRDDADDACLAARICADLPDDAPRRRGHRPGAASGELRA